jgi:hypothetical protein
MVGIGALPFCRQILIDVALPAAVTAVLLLIPKARLGILGANDSSAGRVWSSSRFWIFLAVLYAITLLSHFPGH